MNQSHFVTINLHQQKILLKSTSSKKYQVIILLILDCGLRVSELIQLQCKHILFSQNKIIIVSSTKKRDIPFTQRLLNALADYWQTLKESQPDSCLFPAGKNSKIDHIGRKQIWKKSINFPKEKPILPSLEILLLHESSKKMNYQSPRNYLAIFLFPPPKDIFKFQKLKKKLPFNLSNKMALSQNSIEDFFQLKPSTSSLQK